MGNSIQTALFLKHCVNFCVSYERKLTNREFFLDIEESLKLKDRDKSKPLLIWNALSDLVSFVQFKKREKTLMKECYF